MTAPVVQALRAHYGDKAQIDFITLAKFKGAAELISAIDTIYTLSKSPLLKFLQPFKKTGTTI